MFFKLNDEKMMKFNCLSS